MSEDQEDEQPGDCRPNDPAGHHGQDRERSAGLILVLPRQNAHRFDQFATILAYNQRVEKIVWITAGVGERLVDRMALGNLRINWGNR